MEIDKMYVLHSLNAKETEELKHELIKLFVKMETLTEEEYQRWIYNYFCYVNSRDEIGDVDIMLWSELEDTEVSMCTSPYEKGEPTVICINPDEERVFRFKSYKDVFSVIGSIEHENSHNFEEKYLPGEYQKFVNENGKPEQNGSRILKIVNRIFEGSRFENFATAWQENVYFSFHNEQFARRRSSYNTKRFFLEVIDYAKKQNLPPSQIQKIVEGYEEVAKITLEQCETFAVNAKLLFSNKGIANGVDLAQFKEEWNNFIDAFCQEKLDTLSYMTPKKIAEVEKKTQKIVVLCNSKSIYSQQNFDKLFAWQLGKEELNLNQLMCIICQRRNTESKHQFCSLREKVKGTNQEEEFNKLCQKLFAKKERSLALLEQKTTGGELWKD